MSLGVFSIFYGAFMALAQKDIRRFFAYASVSHVGFMAVGFLSLQTSGIYGALWIMFTEVFCVLGIFLVMEELHVQGYSYLIEKQKGLYKVAPQKRTEAF